MLMQQLPFNIPRSLSSYITQFENEPDKGIANLENHLKKRGMDAVGFFLLSWLYYQNSQKDQAIHYALKARCCAPGSPLLEHLHYFLVHPRHFNAWKPFESDYSTSSENAASVPAGYTLDLDQLIEELSRAEDNKIVISPDKEDDRNLGEKAEKVSDIASETLAKIYEKQERFEEAIRTLEILQQIKPNKSEHYKNEIRRLSERNQSSGMEENEGPNQADSD